MIKRFAVKRIALCLTFFLIILGVIFILLDILDIAEDFRLHWSTAVINTIFISVVAVFIIYFATKNYLRSSSPETLALGGGALAFGFAIILYGWLPNSDLNTRYTEYDSGVFIASAIYLTGAILSINSQNTPIQKIGLNILSITAIYIGIVLIISILTWLAYKDIITFLTHTFSVHFSARDIVQGIAAVFCVSAALIYLKKYRELRHDIYFWYSLGLILFAAGVIFISRGPLEGRIAWLGRAAEYVSYFYFLIASLSACKQSGEKRIANNKDI
ncbi:MAG TPA: hypothetical protein G4O16_08785 [Dehalococcoidia bacterium]|nr:hypothetical protein [Dehalococcoidia bacterium]